ncbi:replication restart helicase PriA [Geobacter argillaceus]|uniref:Replication restart protein PriA n=1 Tax=Geobacter argillaceus TaxID=345631 RepID=A0A562VLR6_9BACT|nr:primosomal protein N' [Geobacter argillaceus]TWJ18903.1 replication restart DNA helicase PriA [Geobacter argillaceus]
MTDTPHLIDVAVALPVDQTFTYSVPPELVPAAVIGCRVLVPFGRRTVTGYVLGHAGETADACKEIREVLDREPLFAEDDLGFYRWIAAYYLQPLGEVIRAALPAGLTVTGRLKTTAASDGTTVTGEVLSKGQRLKTEPCYRASGQPMPEKLRGKALDILQFLLANGEASGRELGGRFAPCGPQLKKLLAAGLIASREREVYRDPFQDAVTPDSPPPLTDEQAAALVPLTAAIDARTFAPFLLHGVTGSGKTEVYLRAIAHALERHKTALVLVPEIALTPQLVGRFRRRFDTGIAVLHSGLSDGERYDQWRRIRRGEVRIVIGARSAIFAPLAEIGVIVVDEEHEGSYKQSEGVRYNARDLALVLGTRHLATVILGSATPLVTSRHAAAGNKLGYLSLSRRVNGLPLPTTTLLDIRGHRKSPLHPALATALAGNLTAGGQAMLLLNRRGFATWLVCSACGEVLHCPNCSVTLTYHQQKRRHLCHYCDYNIPAPSLCPKCESGELTFLGRGTERLEEEIQALLPTACVARMDRDTTAGKGGHARILDRLASGAVDILVGTQMIAKGHDFPGVTLVGVVDVDAVLNLPDFRSSERAFQLVSQVAGRAGRGALPGTVLVQSMVPDHYALQRAARHDYDGFYEEELASRRETGYPPFSYLAAIHLSSPAFQAAEQAAAAAAGQLREIRQALGFRTEILGPAAPPLGKVRGRYRWQILLKGTNRQELHRLAQRFRTGYSPPANVRVAVDIDPVDML